MADLSWAHEAGARRRTALEEAAKSPDGAHQLAAALFDGSIAALWRRLTTGIKETVEAYNTGGRFTDVVFSATPETIRVERRHDPRFAVDVSLDRAAGRIAVHISDGGAAPASESLDVVVVDQELSLWHGGQSENGYQFARRVLKPRL